MRTPRTTDESLWHELALIAPGIISGIDRLVRASDLLADELDNAELDDDLRRRLSGELRGIADTLIERANRMVIEAACEHPDKGCS